MTPRSKPEYLYVHVPFCKSICHYCDFTHTVYMHDRAGQWLDALQKEILHREINPHLKTIYIGGGTPSSLDETQLERLLSMLAPYAKHVCEYTAEVNPETLSEAKAQLLADYGVNRISIGFQCAQADQLKMLGRHHTKEDVLRAMDLLRSKGIDNISLDLMYSLPHQTMDMLKQSIDTALSFAPKHLSLYSLSIEENTVFGKKGMKPLDDETEADMYEYICDTLPRHGFEQYEISNFSLPGYQSVHNRAYWTYRDFMGISCGASGKEGYMRYDHPFTLKEYLQDPLKQEDIPLSKEDAMFEMVMMNLRLKEGMSLNLFQKTFDESFTDAFKGRYEPLCESGQLCMEEGMLKCTEDSWHILNSVLGALL